METGALAMFDALGIRGIWRDHDADEVLRKFETIASTARKRVEREFGGPGHPSTSDPWNVAKKICLGFVTARPGVKEKRDCTEAFLTEQLREHTALWEGQRKLFR